jgi:O-antigen ligase
MLTAAQLLQMSITLILSVVVFMIAYSLKPTVSATLLIILIPFQIIETKYGSANVALTFAIIIAWAIKGVGIRLPMLPQILGVLFAYLITLSMVYPPTMSQHIVYIISLISAVMVFWIVYDLTMRVERLQDIVNVFLIMNICVIIYSVIQLIAGPGERVVLFGIEELHMMRVRADRRLTGPFGAAGIAAEYTAIVLMLILYQLISTKKFWMQIGLVLLGATNLLLLITTGNRGGFLVLIGGGMMFLWMFRSVIGPVRSIGIAAAAVTILTITSIVAINLTEFDLLFERLAETEIEAGIPDTRAIVWPIAWEASMEAPIFGHGPRLRFDGEEDGARYEGHLFILYPHNLYLFLMFTVGIVGMFAFLIFLLTPLVKCWKSIRHSRVETYARGLARTGIIVMTIVLVDGIKVGFLRYAMVDYWHFVFAIMGMLVAVCDRIKPGQSDSVVRKLSDVQ